MTNKQRRLGRSLRSRALALGVVLTATVLVITGCSAAPEAPSTIKGGTLTVATAQINSLDVQGASAASTGTGTVAKAIFSTLVTRGKDNTFVGDLATKWSSTATGTWTFELNPKAVFSDGTPVTSTDVAASIKRIVDQKGPNASLFNGIQSQAPSANELVLTTPASGSLLYSLSLMFVAPASKMDTAGFWDKPIGSGPFQVESFVPGDTVTLTRSPNYWGKAANLDAVKLVNIPEVSGQVTALETGDVDVLVNVPQDQLAEIDASGSAKSVSSAPLSIMALWFNNSQAPFDKLGVRKAMWEAVDWNKLRKDLYGDTAAEATAPIASGVFGYSEQTPYKYDVKAAKADLADAGYATGLSVDFKYNPASFSQLQSFLEAASTYWSKVGIKVNLIPQEQAVYLQDLLALNWGMTETVNTSKTGDADQILGRLYTTKANRLGYSNPQVDQLTAQAAASTDQDARQAAYAKVDKLLWDDIAAIWPMELKSVYAVSNRVTGFVPDPSALPSFVGIKLTSK